MADLIEQSLYEADEHAWIEHQIDVLRSGDLAHLDRLHLVEYLTDMAINNRRELSSRLIKLYAHVVKWHVQPTRRSRSWVLTILEQQRELRGIFKHSKTLRNLADATLAEDYQAAVREAFAEMGPSVRSQRKDWSAQRFGVDDLLNFQIDDDAG